MAMTKAEKARMAELEKQLAMSRAMRFPDYSVPQPMSYDDIKDALSVSGETVVRGWFYNANLGGYGGYSNQATYGCSNGINHSREGAKTSTQGMGRMYRTREEAVMALRHELTTQCAELLARVDLMLAGAA
jgi:hypothetical protein